jgi:hypothetical protein
LNPGRPEYEAGVPATRRQRSVPVCHSCQLTGFTTLRVWHPNERGHSVCLCLSPYAYISDVNVNRSSNFPSAQTRVSICNYALCIQAQRLYLLKISSENCRGFFFVSLIVSHHGASGSGLGQSMWDLWWTKWHWDTGVSEFLGLPPSLSFHPGSIVMYHLGQCSKLAGICRYALPEHFIPEFQTGTYRYLALKTTNTEVPGSIPGHSLGFL